LAKLAAITIVDGLRRNLPETVARLTGGEYFKLTDAKSLENDLDREPLFMGLFVFGRY
jgi:hypothetical protein